MMMLGLKGLNIISLHFDAQEPTTKEERIASCTMRLTEWNNFIRRLTLNHDKCYQNKFSCWKKHFFAKKFFRHLFRGTSLFSGHESIVL